ncbi:MAG TPA: cache domain-containing protein [Rhodopila sp.]|nr:cache domain-containing protein [Rhodopila sp.]
MNILSRLRVRTKLALLLGTFTLGFVALLAIDGHATYQRMLDERVQKLRATVDMTMGLAEQLESKVSARQMSREEELARLREIVHALRFDDGKGYMTLEKLDGTILFHGVNPDLEGKQSTAKDQNGRTLLALALDALRGRDSGTISYLFPKTPSSASFRSTFPSQARRIRSRNSPMLRGLRR